MSDNIRDLLKDMQKRPGVYFGCKSLERLAAFLNGYMCCYGEYNAISTMEWLPRFQEFIEKYYNIHMARHWSEIIRFCCSTDEEAFDKFFELLEIFENKTGQSGQ